MRGRVVAVKQPRNFDAILEQQGGFGRFQVLILILLLALEIPTAFVPFLSVFVGRHPQQWTCDAVEIDLEDICTCNGTLFAPDADSIIAEWNLVCKAEWVSDFITSLQMVGMFIGTLVACKVSDWYGRRYTYLGVTVIMGIGQGVSALATEPYFYAFARFLSGVGLSGFLGVTSVYSLEFLNPKYRALASALSPWGEGVMLLSLLAYYIRPWRLLTLATAVPFALVFFIFPFVPESPRWLLRNQKVEEAHEVLGQMADMNKKPRVELEILKNIAEKEAPVDMDENAGVKRFGYLDFFRDDNLRLATIYQMIIMCSSSMTYYGISFNVKNMHGSPYLIVMLLGLSDAIGYPSALLISNRLGRRTSLAIYMTLGALFLVTLAVLEISIGLRGYPIVVVVLCLLGKFCVAGGRSCARTLVGELYPTACRAMGSGLGGVGASLGGVLAPQLAYLGSHWPSVPYFVFAFIAIVGAIISFFLSETMGKPLTDQVQELNKERNRLTVRRKTLLHSLSLP